MSRTSPRVTAYLCADRAADAIAFYRRAFGAEERSRIEDAAGHIGHLELAIGETTLFLSDESPAGRVVAPAKLSGTAVSFVLSVDDADAWFQRAVDAGARVERPVADAPQGRGGWVIDPFGHRWNIMTPTAGG